MMTTILVIIMSVQIVGMIGLIWLNWRIFQITIELLDINKKILIITDTIATTGVQMNKSLTNLRIPKGYRERSPID